MSVSPRRRLLCRLQYVNGVVRYFSHCSLDPSGCIVYDSTAGVTADKFWEPRLLSGSVTQDVGGLDQGIPRQTLQTVVLTSDPKARGLYGDLIDDFKTQRLEGAEVKLWYGSPTETSISNLTMVFSGIVPFTGCYNFDYRRGIVSVKVQDTFTITGLVTTQSYSAGATGFPDDLAGVITPIGFGRKDAGGSPTGFNCYAFMVGRSGTRSTISIGASVAGGDATVSGNSYAQPTAVRVGGNAATAQSPITDAPAAGEWGSWSATAGTFEIEDGGSVGTLSEDSVIIVDHAGLFAPLGSGAGAAVTNAGQVLSSMFDFCGYTNGTHYLNTTNETWAGHLTAGLNGLDELYGMFPFRAGADPITQIDLFTEAMRRTASLIRRNFQGQFEPVYPGASSTADYTFVAGDIVSLQESLDPKGEYANRTVVQSRYAHVSADRLSSFAVNNASEQTAVGEIVTQTVNFEGFRVRSGAGLETSLTIIHGQAIRVTKATIGPAAAGILPGHRVRYDWRSIDDHLGLGHVRSVTLDLTRGLFTITVYHIVYSL